jgi:hypothetical protein
MTSMPPPLVTIIDAGRVVGFALSRGDAEERSLGTHPTIEQAATAIREQPKENTT